MSPIGVWRTMAGNTSLMDRDRDSGDPQFAHDASEYGARIADEYDDIYEGVFDTRGAVACIADLADSGGVLEFGVGTGRIALALRERGIEVHGIDGSPIMLEQLAAKPGGNAI